MLLVAATAAFASGFGLGALWIVVSCERSMARIASAVEAQRREHRLTLASCQSGAWREVLRSARTARLN
jgi:hypothetical protein